MSARPRNKVRRMAATSVIKALSVACKARTCWTVESSSSWTNPSSYLSTPKARLMGLSSWHASRKQLLHTDDPITSEELRVAF